MSPTVGCVTQIRVVGNLAERKTDHDGHYIGTVSCSVTWSVGVNRYDWLVVQVE